MLPKGLRIVLLTLPISTSLHAQTSEALNEIKAKGGRHNWCSEILLPACAIAAS
jgi:hypothetical protein